MKRYHALVIDTQNPPKQLNPDLTLDLNLTSYDTLADAMLDRSWNPDGNKDLRLILFKTQPDGSLRTIRYMYGNAVPGTGTWYTLDKTDEDAGYLYGKDLSAEDLVRVDADTVAQQDRYKQWELEQRRSALEWREGRQS